GREGQDQLTHAFLGDVRESVLEGAHPLAEPLRIATQAHGETTHEVVDARRELLLEAAHEPAHLRLELATHVDDTALDSVAASLGLVDQRLAAAPQHVLARPEP